MTRSTRQHVTGHQRTRLQGLAVTHPFTFAAISVVCWLVIDLPCRTVIGVVRGLSRG
jgi:hypothetical protein